MQQLVHPELLSRASPAAAVRVGTAAAIACGHVALLWVFINLRAGHPIIQVASEMKATIITLPVQTLVPAPFAPLLTPVPISDLAEDLPDVEIRDVVVQHDSSLGQVQLGPHGHRGLTNVEAYLDHVALPTEDPNAARLPVQRFSPARIAQLPITARTVRVAVFVQPDGRISDVALEGSSGHPAIDQAALEYVRTWKFMPGSRNGVAEAMWVSQIVVFPTS